MKDTSFLTNHHVADPKPSCGSFFNLKFCLLRSLVVSNLVHNKCPFSFLKEINYNSEIKNSKDEEFFGNSRVENIMLIKEKLSNSNGVNAKFSL